MKKEDLINLIKDDDLGLLNIKPKNSVEITPDERLITSFLEINNFVKEHNREPLIGSGLHEHQLAARLKSIRGDNEKIQTLKKYDEYKILNFQPVIIESIVDIFNDDDLNILNNQDESLFNLKHVQSHNVKKESDYIAHRKPCKNFQEYEKIFQQCQEELANGKRKLVKFQSDQQIQEKRFFVLNGVLLYIDEIGETYIDKYGKIDGRQRCIFENGTESEMLFRSLVKRLYENGHAVSENSDDIQINFEKDFQNISQEDTKTGYIYVVKSLSTDPKIQSLENLYKIGFSVTPVEQRVKNATDEATYLFSSVAIVTTFECYNLNPQKFENILHTFFGAVRLNFDVFDNDGKRYSPREWFIVPLGIIEEMIQLVISGQIINYTYNPVLQKIIKK